MKCISLRETAVLLKMPIVGVQNAINTGQLALRRRWYGTPFFLEHEVIALRIALDQQERSSLFWKETVTDRQMRKQRERDPYDLDFTYLVRAKR